MITPVARIDPARLQWTGEEVWVHAPRGSEILAPKAGHVRMVGVNGDVGHFVLLRHLDGTLSAFTHLDGPAPVLAGAYVAEGAVVARVGEAGSRGAALVWRVYGAGGAYVDPRSWLRTPRGLAAFAAVCAGLLVAIFLVPDGPPERPRMPM